jgi:stage II sporulation protein D
MWRDGALGAGGDGNVIDKRNPLNRHLLCFAPPAVLVVASAYSILVFGGIEAKPADSNQPQVHVRDVRVLVASDLQRVRVRCESGLRITDAATGRSEAVSGGDWLDMRLAPTGVVFIADQPWSGAGVFFDSTSGQSIWFAPHREGEPSAGTEYPGRLHLIVRDGSLSVINEVDIERYAACVVASEIWPDFAAEAFRTQAIVTRTYVLYHMLRRPDATYDVVATQGSQVYRGIREDTVGRRAAEAAEYTRGLVCTYREDGHDRIFCTYYGAACGGLSQSAAKLGAEGDIEPLAGGVRCDYCRIAPGQTYRWGSARIGAEDVLAKLTVRYPEIVGLGRITAITPIEKTPSGRPVTLRITGSSGAFRDLLAERFRLAVGPNTVRSTDCKIRVTDGEVIIEDGKGFGHGLGLCQWGMQGQALEGRTTAEILRYYYPGSRLTRVY